MYISYLFLSLSNSAQMEVTWVVLTKVQIIVCLDGMKDSNVFILALLGIVLVNNIDHAIIWTFVNTTHITSIWALFERQRKR